MVLGSLAAPVSSATTALRPRTADAQEESVDNATTLRRITSVEIVIELNDSEAEMLRAMTANRNSVSRRMGYTSGASMAEMAAFILRDELPEKAEFWRQQAELRTQMEGAAK